MWISNTISQTHEYEHLESAPLTSIASHDVLQHMYCFIFSHFIFDNSCFYPSAFQIQPLGVKEIGPSALMSTETLQSPTSLAEQHWEFHAELDQEPHVTIGNSMESTPIVAAPVKDEQERANNPKKSGNTSGGNTQVVTVGTVIPRPMKCLVDPDRVSARSDELLRQVIPCISDHLSHDLGRCINSLSNYVSVSAKTYTLRV